MEEYDKLCRVCLKLQESFEYTLFDNLAPTVFTFCTAIEVDENEPLPKNFCNACYDDLTKYYDFKDKCIKSQNILLGHLENSIKIENDNKYSIQPHDIKYEDNEDLHLYENDISQDQQDFDSKLDKTLLHDGFKTDRKENIKEKLYKTKNNNKKLKVRNSTSNMKHKKTCKLCGKKFKFQDSLEHHLLEHEGLVQSKSCQQCAKNFLTWSSLRRHIENEHTIVNLTSLQCSYCGKICKNKSILQAHERRHRVGNKEHICDICGKSFTNKLILMGHFETHNKNRQKVITCDQCGKKFFTEKHLKNHKSRTHIHPEQKFICHICSFSFTQKYNLAKHILTLHEGQKPFKCDICLKSYAKQSSLLEHKRSHSGEKPFHCEYCERSFISKRRLTDHHKIHTGERPHKCGSCNLRFTQRGTLVRHMKIHDKLTSLLN